jgi:hypothetical protein
MKTLPIIGQSTAYPAWRLSGRPSLGVDLETMDRVTEELMADDQHRQSMMAAPAAFLKDRRIQVQSGRLFDLDQLEEQEREVALREIGQVVPLEAAPGEGPPLPQPPEICSANVFCNLNVAVNVNVATKVFVELAVVVHAAFLVKVATRVVGPSDVREYRDPVWGAVSAVL